MYTAAKSYQNVRAALIVKHLPAFHCRHSLTLSHEQLQHAQQRRATAAAAAVVEATAGRHVPLHVQGWLSLHGRTEGRQEAREGHTDVG